MTCHVLISLFMMKTKTNLSNLNLLQELFFELTKEKHMSIFSCQL